MKVTESAVGASGDDEGDSSAGRQLARNTNAINTGSSMDLIGALPSGFPASGTSCEKGPPTDVGGPDQSRMELQFAGGLL